MPGLYLPFAQRLFSDHDEVGRVAQRDLCDRVGFDDLQVFNARSLRRILASYFTYYHRARTHLSLGKDSPEPRLIEPREMGRVVALPQVGGLHHRYQRSAA